MENADHHDPIVTGVVEERIGKAMDQNSTECPIDNLKC